MRPVGTGADREAAGELVDQWLAACEKEREKLDHYAALIRDLELRAEARKAEALRLAERSRLDGERAAFLKERLKVHFMRHSLKTMETARFRITHASNGGLLPLLLDSEAESLPTLSVRGSALPGESGGHTGCARCGRAAGLCPLW